MFFLLLLFFLPIQSTYAKLHVTYHQLNAQISNIQRDGTILCEDGTKFKQANSQMKNTDLHVGEFVYIKYFILLRENYYVAINSKIDGPFDLRLTEELNLNHTAR